MSTVDFQRSFFYHQGFMSEIARKHFIFVPLAMNQTLFYEKVADFLVKKQHQVSFICFHERSHHYLIEKGHKSFNPYRETALPTKSSELFQEFETLCRKYKLPSYHHLLTHEQVAYGIKDADDIVAKYVWTLKSLESIFEKNFKDKNCILIQELGGFASVISTYHVARAYGLNHHFIEPSYFRGRYFLIENSFGPVSFSQLAPEINPEVKAIIEKVQKSQEIVIPFKDRAHYLNLFDKVFNAHNFKRFYQKLADKYIRGYYEEFRYISGFTKRQLKAFINKKKLSRFFIFEQKLTRPFIYFPLHVPLDVAITFRSPVFKDQLMLIDLLCRSCPLGYDVVFKEHPAMVGVLDADGIIPLLKKYKHLRMLHPTVNNYKILNRAQTVVTVNSKSGAEALSLGKNVIVLGDAFYTKSPLVHELRDLSQLSRQISEILQKSAIDQASILKYFSAIWSESHPGDIYQLDKTTTDSFAAHFESLHV